MKAFPIGKGNKIKRIAPAVPFILIRFIPYCLRDKPDCGRMGSSYRNDYVPQDSRKTGGLPDGKQKSAGT